MLVLCDGLVRPMLSFSEKLVLVFWFFMPRNGRKGRIRLHELPIKRWILSSPSGSSPTSLMIDLIKKCFIFPSALFFGKRFGDMLASTI